MAIELSYHGRTAILQNMFSNFYRLGVRGDQGDGRNLVMAFFSGTRPTIAELTTNNKLVWQTSLTGISGATRLWPTSTSAFSDTRGIAINTTLFASPPQTSLTIDWTNNSFTTTPSTIAQNLLFNAGTITWFAVYGGIAQAASTDISIWFTGTVGVTGSGADIEMNRVDIPSAGYPVELKRLSYKFPQPTGVDLIFNKDIYTTALCNIFAGLSGVTHANAKVVHNGSVHNSNNRVLLYSGTRPATPNDAVPAGATLIASVDVFRLNVTDGGPMTSVATTSEISVTRTGNYIGTSVATGNPTWCRIMSHAGLNASNATTNANYPVYASLDCSAGLPGSGAAVIYNDPITVVGQQVNITSLKFAHTLPPA